MEGMLCVHCSEVRIDSSHWGEVIAGALTACLHYRRFTKAWVFVNLTLVSGGESALIP